MIPLTAPHFPIGKREFQQPFKDTGYNAKVLQQSQYKIARVTGLLHDDHTDLNTSILNDRHIYDVVV